MGSIGHARITARSQTGPPVFVGVARTSDVRTYLRNCSYSMVDRLLSIGMMRDRVMPHYRSYPGADAHNLLPRKGSGPPPRRAPGRRASPGTSPRVTGPS